MTSPSKLQASQDIQEEFKSEFRQTVEHYYKAREKLEDLEIMAGDKEQEFSIQPIDATHPKDPKLGQNPDAKDGKASILHHNANPGPAMPQGDIGKPASKEETKARAEELNK